MGSSVPKTKVDVGVPHKHTVDSLLKEKKKPFEKEARGAFADFLEDNGVAVLAAHNGKRYVRFFILQHEDHSFSLFICNRTIASWHFTDSNRLLAQGLLTAL